MCVSELCVWKSKQRMHYLFIYFATSCSLTLYLSCSVSGSLIQLPSVERGKLSKVRLGSLSLKKEGDRQCFLFTKHFLICTRSSGGKLHLLKVSQAHMPVQTHTHTSLFHVQAQQLCKFKQLSSVLPVRLDLCE